MPEKIVQLNEEVIKGQLKELVRGSVEPASSIVRKKALHMNEGMNRIEVS